MDGRTRLAQTEVEFADKTYRLAHPESAEALFDEREFARDERIPYWADLWPSSRALAEHLAGLDMVGKRAIELGCGVGLPCVVAADLGAVVSATDHYAPALDFAAYNAFENTGRVIETRLLDWHHPDEISKLGGFDLVLAADVLYERKNVGPLVALVSELLSEGGEFILADPRRDGGRIFVCQMESGGFVVDSKEAVVLQDGREVVVEIHTMKRA